MEYVERFLNIRKYVEKKSCFLLGPRATGKSCLLRNDLPQAFYIDLLKSKDRIPLSRDPSRLAEIVKADPKRIVIIDEVQNLPELLDEVHWLIEEEGARFVLSGSSARKLKRSGVNLLGGRARNLKFFPLTWFELSRSGHFELERFLLRGGLPSIYFAVDNFSLELSDYVDFYLIEEIKKETGIRNLQGFDNFLASMAFRHCEVLNYTSVSSDVQLSIPTVREYVGVLIDTLLGFTLEPWRGPKAKCVQTPKFHFFDLGIVWHLLEVNKIVRNSNLYGKAFESFIVQEVRAYLGLTLSRKKLAYWRSRGGNEVDIVISPVGVEVKSSKRVDSKDLRNLIKLRDDEGIERVILVSQDSHSRIVNGVELLNYADFLSMLWKGEVF